LATNSSDRPARPGWSLTTRLVVLAVVPALVAVVLTGAITVGLTRLSAQSVEVAELRSDVEALARAAPELIALLDQPDRAPVLAAVLRLADARVFPLRNGVINVPDGARLLFVRTLDVSALEAGVTVTGRARTADGQNVLYAAHAIGTRTNRTQVVVATKPVPRLGRIPGGGGRLLLAGVIAAAVAVLLAAVLGRRLGRPLRELSGAAHAVAAGDYGRKVDTTVGGEIGMLAADFNALSGGLADARRREREFVMDVSHDLRTPLTSIRGYAEGIVDGKVEAATAGPVILAEAARLERLVGDLLSLERLEAGQMEFAFEEVGLAGLLAEVLDGRRPAFAAAGVGLALVADPAAGRATVWTDPDRMAQVVGNLLDNALRYSPEGSTVRVDVAAGAAGGAEVAVADEGPGIAPADLARVFERLYVANRYPGERRSGSGLGLAIVARIMQALGGTVRAESDGRHGTVFRLTLPRRVASPAQPSSGG
jgi:two-component system sensor histidine kinase BaeS